MAISADVEYCIYADIVGRSGKSQNVLTYYMDGPIQQCIVTQNLERFVQYHHSSAIDRLKGKYLLCEFKLKIAVKLVPSKSI
jgi:hypothetical protein